VPGKGNTRQRRRDDLGRLTRLPGGHRLDAAEVDQLRKLRLSTPEGPFRIERLDHLWAAVGRFGLAEVAERADLKPERLREALADLACEEIAATSSLVRRSLERWRLRWPWRVAAVLALGLVALSLYLAQS